MSAAGHCGLPNAVGATVIDLSLAIGVQATCGCVHDADGERSRHPFHLGVLPDEVFDLLRAPVPRTDAHPTQCRTVLIGVSLAASVTRRTRPKWSTLALCATQRAPSSDCTLAESRSHGLASPKGVRLSHDPAEVDAALRRFIEDATRKHKGMRQRLRFLPPLTRQRGPSRRKGLNDMDVAYSLDTLGAAVHGAHLPTRKGLIAAWDNWEPCLHLMLDRM